MYSLSTFLKKRLFLSIDFSSALLAVFLLAVVIAPLGCQKAKHVRVLKLAHSLDVQSPVHRSMVYMAKRLTEISHGKMRIDIYPDGQLGAERELIELLQIGSLAMTKVSTSPLEGFVPEMKIYSLPYLFKDEKGLWKVLNGRIGKELLLAGQPYYLRGLCYYDAGSRSFYTKKRPILKPSDLRGLKIRVQKSATSFDMIRAMGGSPTPISWGELYTALQQGVVDGAENNPPSFYFSKHYEVCHYYSLDEHTMVPDVVLISTHIWNKLTPQEQKWLQQAADESVIYQRNLWKKVSDDCLAKVQAAGVKVFHPDKKPFQEAVQGIYKKYEGTHLGELIKEIRRIQETSDP